MTLSRKEREAWNLYLEQCRAAPAEVYDEVERWAWAALQRTLLSLRKAVYA